MAQADGVRDEMVMDLFNRFEKIREKLQDRQQKKVETIEELESSAARRHKEAQEKMDNVLQGLRHKVEEEKISVGMEQTRKVMVTKELIASKAALAEIVALNDEMAEEVNGLKRKLQTKKNETDMIDKETKATIDKTREAELRLEQETERLETEKISLEHQSMAKSEEETMIASLRQQIADKRAAQEKRNRDLEGLLEELQAKESRLRQEMEASYALRLVDIEKKAAQSRQEQLDELDSLMKTQCDEEMSRLKYTYETLERELSEISKNDLTSAIDSAKMDLQEALRKVESMSDLSVKLVQLQKTRAAEISSRAEMRAQQEQEQEIYKEKYLNEVARGHRLAEHNRLLDAEIERLKGLIEAGERLLGLHSAQDELKSVREEDDSQTGTARKRRKMIRKTKKRLASPVEADTSAMQMPTEHEPIDVDFDGDVEVDEEASMDMNPVVEPELEEQQEENDTFLQMDSTVEGDMEIVQVGAKGDFVVLHNRTMSQVEMNGWRLVSSRMMGDGEVETLQEFFFDNIVLLSGNDLALSFGQESSETELFEYRETIPWSPLPMERTLLSLFGFDHDGQERLVALVNVFPPGTTLMDDIPRGPHSGKANESCCVM